MATYLMHFGIKGMSWGRRRFQYEDGSLTPEGKRRYGVADGPRHFGNGSSNESSRSRDNDGSSSSNSRRKMLAKVAIGVGATAAVAAGAAIAMRNPMVRGIVNKYANMAVNQFHVANSAAGSAISRGRSVVTNMFNRGRSAVGRFAKSRGYGRRNIANIGRNAILRPGDLYGGYGNWGRSGYLPSYAKGDYTIPSRITNPSAIHVWRGRR